MTLKFFVWWSYICLVCKLRTCEFLWCFSNCSTASDHNITTSLASRSAESVVHWLVSSITTQMAPCDSQQCSAHCFFGLPWVAIQTFYMTMSQLILGFYLPCWRMMLKMVSFGLLTCVTSNRHFWLPMEVLLVKLKTVSWILFFFTPPSVQVLLCYTLHLNVAHKWKTT